MSPILPDHISSASLDLADQEAAISLRQRVEDLKQLTKPRIAVMVIVTVFIGYVMGVRALAAEEGASLGIAAALEGRLAHLLVTLAGITLCCMSSSVFNQVIERDTDALMDRTRDRPLPAGRLSVRLAMALGLALTVVGLALLSGATNLLTFSLTAFTVASYSLIYTPMKRVSSTCTIIGAVPGALPPVLGYTAATGRLGVEALLLFAILFLWQLPHFLAIAWLYREDYARAGLPMLPVVDTDGRATFRQMMLECLALLPLGLMPTMLGVTGKLYFAGALLCGLAFLASGVVLMIGRTRRQARIMFLTSLVYLPVVFALMLVDQL